MKKKLARAFCARLLRWHLACAPHARGVVNWAAGPTADQATAQSPCNPLDR